MRSITILRLCSMYRWSTDLYHIAQMNGKLNDFVTEYTKGPRFTDKYGDSTLSDVEKLPAELRQFLEDFDTKAQFNPAIQGVGTFVTRSARLEAKLGLSGNISGGLMGMVVDFTLPSREMLSNAYKAGCFTAMLLVCASLKEPKECRLPEGLAGRVATTASRGGGEEAQLPTSFAERVVSSAARTVVRADSSWTVQVSGVRNPDSSVK